MRRFHFLAIFFLIFIVFGSHGLSPDGLALLAFKSAVSDDPGGALAGWIEDDEDPCRWPGVTCANVSGFQDPRVVGVAVAAKNLSGYVPSELGSLIFLRRLNLHGNRLSGSIPTPLFNASSLHSLFLYDNNLSGVLPPAICDLPRLQNLDISKNSLSGTLPPELRNCRQLQRLLLSQNRFSGAIPAGIWLQMVSLVQLDLSSNQFNGSIPPELGDLDSLGGTLNLSHNQFSGEIPGSLGKLPSTVSLDLRYNNLSGEIPQAGSLANQGPTAFLNNEGLCGFPLQIPCQGRPAGPPGRQVSPPVKEAAQERKGLRTGLIVIISVADAAGVALIGLIVVYIYWKLKDRDKCCSCTGKSKLGGEGEKRGGCGCWPAGGGGSRRSLPSAAVPLVELRLRCLPPPDSPEETSEFLIMSSVSSTSNGSEKQSLFEEQQAKIGIVKASLGSLSDKLSLYCSDASIARYLVARNWNVKKATKMLKETLKWRLQYKPEEIRWEEVANEAETGKIYRTNYFDKYGRSILVMRPGCQNTKSTKGQIRYLVYCMENAILNLPPEQEQMVWLIDFHGFNLSNISVKVTKETAHVLQDHYPERLGLAILYNPPKFFESFWMVVKPFLEPKTYKKVKFVYSDDHGSKKIMEQLFNLDELECAFGGNNQVGFDINEYAQRMREDDKRTPLFWSQENALMSSKPFEIAIADLGTGNSESDSDQSHKECEGKSGTHMPNSECSPVDGSVEITGNGKSGGSDQQSV